MRHYAYPSFHRSLGDIQARIVLGLLCEPKKCRNFDERGGVMFVRLVRWSGDHEEACERRVSSYREIGQTPVITARRLVLYVSILDRS